MRKKNIETLTMSNSEGSWKIKSICVSNAKIKSCKSLVSSPNYLSCKEVNLMNQSDQPLKDNSSIRPKKILLGTNSKTRSLTFGN
jgi:hypothetical protein